MSTSCNGNLTGQTGTADTPLRWGGQDQGGRSLRVDLLVTECAA
jgi:hypothetical protein